MPKEESYLLIYINNQKYVGAFTLILVEHSSLQNFRKATPDFSLTAHMEDGGRICYLLHSSSCVGKAGEVTRARHCESPLVSASRVVCSVPVCVSVCVTLHLYFHDIQAVNKQIIIFWVSVTCRRNGLSVLGLPICSNRCAASQTPPRAPPTPLLQHLTFYIWMTRPGPCRDWCFNMRRFCIIFCARKWNSVQESEVSCCLGVLRVGSGSSYKHRAPCISL